MSTRTRATQTIPPATRRLVVRRDGGRCKVPGCRASQFLEVHHLRPRSEGGTHDPDGLALLCGAHHGLLHRGFLIVEGFVSAGLAFRHADGTAYGEAARPEDVEASGEAFRALRTLGLAETEAHAALRCARAHVSTGARAEELVAAALRGLAPRPARRYTLRASEEEAEYAA